MSRHLVLHLQYLHLVRRGWIVLDIDKPKTDRSLLYTLVRGYSLLSVLKCTAMTNVGSAVYKVSPLRLRWLGCVCHRLGSSAAPPRSEETFAEITLGLGAAGAALCCLLRLHSAHCCFWHLRDVRYLFS